MNTCYQLEDFTFCRPIVMEYWFMGAKTLGPRLLCHSLSFPHNLFPFFLLFFHLNHMATVYKNVGPSIHSASSPHLHIWSDTFKERIDRTCWSDALDVWRERRRLKNHGENFWLMTYATRWGNFLSIETAACQIHDLIF